MFLRSLRRSWRLLYVILVPLLLLPIPFSLGGKAGWCAYILLWMAFYWTAEAIPLPVTSFMPVILFPLFGILSSAKVSTFYLNEIGILIVCSLTMAAAVESSNLHRRIALKSLLAIGTSNLRLLLGFMLVTMFLSMWIPNTASTSIMAPIVMAVVDQMHASSKLYKNHPEPEMTPCTRHQLRLRRHSDRSRGRDTRNNNDTSEDAGKVLMRKTMLLSVAYAANIGGTGSLIGTAPNLVLKGLFEELFPMSTELTFATWMLYNVPTMILCVLLAWIYLQWTARSALRDKSADALEERIREEILRRYKELGSFSFPETAVLTLMITMIILWFTLKPQIFTGWVELFPYAKMIKPTVPAMAITFLLFIIPKNPRSPSTSPPLLTWEEANEKAQWGIAILIGGGMCLAEASKESGLSSILVENLKSLEVLPTALTALILCFAASMFTEITSNTAVSSILLPVVCEMAVALQVHPLYLALPVTIGCSFSFMLPAATPPNAIVFGLAKLKILDMAKPGFIMNTICVLVEVAMIHALGFPIFGLTTYPSWADHPKSGSGAVANNTLVPSTDSSH
ncbi:solute carrier family 13 member 2 [Ixodes scapularis]|uniref:solute carrier family 13 member 2 n=1 Tax=Ixodes scapularis TaxID=6945 RepID=UPI001C390469|nr:solute carrier family 13 member 2 [Ixodes scapularis]